MARRGARGKGWIRLMRIITWVLAALMLLAGILAGIAVMNASGSTQTSVGQIPTAQNNGATFYLTVEGTGGGIAIMVFMAIIAVIFLTAMNVYLDMAENVRRIAGRLSRRQAIEEE